MDLINFNTDSSNNLLPFDGEVFLYENFLIENEAFEWYELLEKNIAWKQEGMKMYGKYLDFPRLSAWYGDAGKVYKYSGLVNTPLPFTKELLVIKETIEKKTGKTFNAALLNLYRDGRDSMGWHSDDEKELGNNPVIASLSFGATRTFQLKHKVNKEKRSILLPNNSLLMMQGSTQHFWQHQIPKTAQQLKPRINITFRKIL